MSEDFRQKRAFDFGDVRLCHVCKGRGERRGLRCRACNGSGVEQDVRQDARNDEGKPSNA